jgi:hypothetical protein
MTILYSPQKVKNTAAKKNERFYIDLLINTEGDLQADASRTAWAGLIFTRSTAFTSVRHNKKPCESGPFHAGPLFFVQKAQICGNFAIIPLVTRL